MKFGEPDQPETEDATKTETCSSNVEEINVDSTKKINSSGDDQFREEAVPQVPITWKLFSPFLSLFFKH